MQELRDIREIARFATKLLSTVLLTIEICVKPQSQCAFTIYHETTLYYYYLKSIGVGWVGWKSKKVSRYFCTAPPRNVSLPRLIHSAAQLRARRRTPDPGFPRVTFTAMDAAL